MLIAQITDLHVAAEGPGVGLVDTAAHLAAAIDFIDAMPRKADVVVVTGDLVNDASEPEYTRLAALLRELRTPLYLLPGNHDDPAVMAAVFPEHTYLRPTPAGTYDYVADLGEVGARRDGHEHPRLRDGAVGDAQLAWLDATLGRLSAKPVLIAMHHPPFETGIWWMDAMGLEGAAEFAEVLGRHPNARRVICGHVHRSITATVGAAIVSVAPSTGHQVRLDLGDASAGDSPTSNHSSLCTCGPAPAGSGTRSPSPRRAASTSPRAGRASTR